MAERKTEPAPVPVSGLAHIGSLQAENRRLRAQLQESQTRGGQVTTLQQQLQQLEALIQIKDRLGLGSSIGANVIGSSVGNFHWTISIDRGSADGVEVNDPLTFLSVAVVLMVVGIVAAMLPARRASRIDPMIALRCE